MIALKKLICAVTLIIIAITYVAHSELFNYKEGDGGEEREYSAAVSQSAAIESCDEDMITPDPLAQLVQALSRQAQADQSTDAIADDDLYIRM